MKNHKVLLVSAAFYPEVSPRSFRATELAKQLSAMGHQVTVVTLKQQGVNYDNLFSGIQFEFVGGNPLDGINLSGNRFIVLLKRIITRLLLILFEYPAIGWFFVFREKLKSLSGYDAVISFAVPYPTHWAVAYALVKNKKLAPIWIADCGDPYMGQQNDTFKPAFYFKYVEKWFCKKATYLTVPTQLAIQGYYPEFHEKIKVIPQGFNFNEVSLAPFEKQFKKLVFGYGGVFMPGKRDPRPFLNFLSQVDNLEYEFHIYTSTPQLVQPYAEKDTRIKLFAPISRNQLLTEFSKMAFVVNFENLGQVQTPSKLIDYAIIQKPILSIPANISSSPIWLEFLNRDYRNAYQLENIDQYRIENVARKFVGLIQS